jgi:hypothetical protein
MLIFEEGECRRGEVVVAEEFLNADRDFARAGTLVNLNLTLGQRPYPP